MTMHLRDLPEGQRFMLCRNGLRYRLLRHERVEGKMRHFVEPEGRPQRFPPHLSFIHGSSHVKPVVTAS